MVMIRAFFSEVSMSVLSEKYSERNAYKAGRGEKKRERERGERKKEERW